MSIVITVEENNKSLAFKGCNGCKPETHCCVKYSRLNGINLYDYEIGCKYFPVFFVVDNENKPVHHFEAFYSFYNNISCPYLDENKQCMVYNERTLICRLYPVGWRPLGNDENHYAFGYNDSCPGCINISKNENNDNDNILKLIEDNQLNQNFISKFFPYDYMFKRNEFVAKTAEFINFCFNHNVLNTIEKIRLKDGRFLNLKGSNIHGFTKYRVVDVKTFNNLPDEIRAEALKKGYTYLLNLHIQSLENINKLYETAEKQNRVSQELIII